jgi:hypothetical protein
MMTEHDRGFSASRYDDYRAACARATSDEVYVVPGIEYSDPDNRVHVLVWGPVPFLGEGLATDVLLEEVARHEGLAVLAHPARRKAFELFKPEWAERLLGIEVWNRKYDGWAPSEKVPALVQQARSVPFVGLDFHSARQLFPLGMALDIDGPINESSVVDCLRNRRCSARVFGGRLDQQRFERTLPVLQMAEKGRRRLAALKHYSKARLSR